MSRLIAPPDTYIDFRVKECIKEAPYLGDVLSVQGDYVVNVGAHGWSVAKAKTIRLHPNSRLIVPGYCQPSSGDQRRFFVAVVCRELVIDLPSPDYPETSAPVITWQVHDKNWIEPWKQFPTPSKAGAGGHGAAGEPGRDGKNGLHGKEIQTPWVYLLVEKITVPAGFDPVNRLLTIVADGIAGHGGQAGEAGQAGGDGGDGWNSRSDAIGFCLSGAEDGGDGGLPGRGGIGGNGGPGPSGGAIFFHGTPQAKDMARHVAYSTEPGRPGEAGAGGAGGGSSEGGEAGLNYPPCFGYSSKPGRDRDPRPPSPAGSPGDRGGRGLVYVKDLISLDEYF